MVNEEIKIEKLDNEKVTMWTLLDCNGYENCKIILPSISDEELINRYKKIKPIIMFEDSYYDLREFTPDELRKYSYIYNIETNKKNVIDMSKLTTIGEFPCYHTYYGYHYRFKPSIEEILSQFPDNLLKDADSFYLCSIPQDDDIVKAGCHKSRVKALARK